jgi:hypothetical protein
MIRRRKLAILGACALILLLIPTPYLASPEWTVAVTDQDGHPLQGMLVRLDYENYSVENTSHELERYTDASGRAVFPQQKRFALLASRCYFTTLSAMALAHASFGPSAYLNVFGLGREGSPISNGVEYFWNGRPDRVSTTVVARKIKLQG